jgi:hypothetical protein
MQKSKSSIQYPHTHITSCLSISISIPTPTQRRQVRAQQSQQCRPGERPRYDRVSAMSARGPWLLPHPPAPSNPGVTQTNLSRATHRGNGGPAGGLNGVLVRETWRRWTRVRR